MYSVEVVGGLAVPDPSLFGAVLGDQAVLFLPRSQVADVDAVRGNITCFPGGSSDQLMVVGDFTELIPFDVETAALLAVGPKSAVEATTTTSTTTTSTTTTVAPAQSDGDVRDAPGRASAPPPPPTDGRLSAWMVGVGILGVALAGWGFAQVRKHPR